MAFRTSMGADAAGRPALTQWLHQTIQSGAGVAQDRPLTLGDLWAGRLLGDEERDAYQPPIDTSRRTRELRDSNDRTLPLPAKCVWFTDGGVCSNFPIHLGRRTWRCIPCRCWRYGRGFRLASCWTGTPSSQRFRGNVQPGSSLLPRMQATAATIIGGTRGAGSD
jgi:hypothetical protein